MDRGDFSGYKFPWELLILEKNIFGNSVKGIASTPPNPKTRIIFFLDPSDLEFNSASIGEKGFSVSAPNQKLSAPTGAKKGLFLLIFLAVFEIKNGHNSKSYGLIWNVSSWALIEIAFSIEWEFVLGGDFWLLNYFFKFIFLCNQT